MIMWYKGSYSLIKILSYREQLLALLDTFTNYIKKVFESCSQQNFIIPVLVLLFFCFHTVLTSLIQLQGDGDVYRFTEIIKKSFNKLFQQLEDISNSTIPSITEYC